MGFLLMLVGAVVVAYRLGRWRAARGVPDLIDAAVAAVGCGHAGGGCGQCQASLKSALMNGARLAGSTK